jgi:peroxiredoxin
LKEASLPDTVILAVSVDKKTDLQKIFAKTSADKINPALLLLSDPGHKVIDRYGILNPESNGLPHPATYVIDKEGIVRWKFLEVNYRVRPTNEQVLEALKSLR